MHTCIRGECNVHVYAINIQCGKTDETSYNHEFTKCEESGEKKKKEKKANGSVATSNRN